MPRKYQNPKLQIRQEGKRPYYFIRVRVPILTAEGRKLVRQSKLLGFVGEISQKEAQKKRAEILDVLNSGRILIESQVRFKDVAERFLAVRVPQLGAAAQAKYRCQIAKHILPAFGELRMFEIDAPAVEGWLTQKAATLSWWSRVDLMGILSAIFTAAASWKLWSGDNPTKGVRIGRKVPAREKRLLTAEQLRAILSAVSEDTRLIILIAALTGLRISEIMGLQWRDIDLEAGTLTVRRRWYRGDLDEPKTEASKRTRALGPLADELVLRRNKLNYAGVGVDGDTRNLDAQVEAQAGPQAHGGIRGAPEKHDVKTNCREQAGRPKSSNLAGSEPARQHTTSKSAAEQIGGDVYESSNGLPMHTMRAISEDVSPAHRGLPGATGARNSSPQNWIFNSGGSPPDERDILRYELRPILKRLGIYAPGMGFHAFRRLHTTLLQSEGGATPIEAQKALGHTRLDVTMLYSLTDRERDAQQVARLFEHLIGPVTTKPI